GCRRITPKAGAGGDHPIDVRRRGSASGSGAMRAAPGPTGLPIRRDRPVKRTLRAVLAAAVLPLLAGMVLLATRPAAAAGLTQVTNFGTNPSNLGMYLYVPANLAPHPALL